MYWFGSLLGEVKFKQWKLTSMLVVAVFFASLISQPGVQVADLRQRYDAIGSGHDIQSPRGGTASADGSQLRDETPSQSLQHLATFLYPKKDRCKAEDEVRVLSAEALSCFKTTSSYLYWPCRCFTQVIWTKQNGCTRSSENPPCLFPFQTGMHSVLLFATSAPWWTLTCSLIDGSFPPQHMFSFRRIWIDYVDLWLL